MTKKSVKGIVTSFFVGWAIGDMVMLVVTNNAIAFVLIPIILIFYIMYMMAKD